MGVRFLRTVWYTLYNTQGNTMASIFATRKTPTFNQLRRSVRASIRLTIARKAALRGLEVRTSRTIYVTV